MAWSPQGMSHSGRGVYCHMSSAWFLGRSYILICVHAFCFLLAMGNRKFLLRVLLKFKSPWLSEVGGITTSSTSAVMWWKYIVNPGQKSHLLFPSLSHLFAFLITRFPDPGEKKKRYLTKRWMRALSGSRSELCWMPCSPSTHVYRLSASRFWIRWTIFVLPFDDIV